jgi:hypothetical protein
LKPDLDHWLPDPAMRVTHRRESSAAPERLWACARQVRVRDAALLGRMIRWRIPGVPGEIAFDQLFRHPPFIVLESDEDGALASGIVGRIWTLRRDYPQLSDPEDFRSWSQRGTARVLFANWVEPIPDGRAALVSESRVEAIGRQGKLGVAAIRPLVSGFQHLIGTDGIMAAIRLAEEHPT